MYNGSDFSVTLLQKEDAKALHCLMMDNTDRFKTYFPKTLAANSTLKKSKEFVATISEDIKHNIQYLYTIKVKEALVGLIYLKELDWSKKEGEFAYCIDKHHAQKGFITKALRLLSNYAIETLQLETLKIIAHHSNSASVRIAEKCGFTLIKKLPNSFTPPNGVPLDMQLFELKR